MQPGLPWQIASAAIVDLSAFALAEGPYETHKTVTVWAIEAYQCHWDVDFPHRPLVSPVADLVKAVSALHTSKNYRLIGCS
jgi:hypothetical protein